MRKRLALQKPKLVVEDAVVEDADAEEGAAHDAPVKDPGDALKALRDAAVASFTKSAQSAEPGAAHRPSEALVDAVVNMVHAEPSSLSVFASGSSFIHGVKGGESDLHAHISAPSSTPGGDSAAKPGDVRKLDRAAAELLRPMLRQWLADNMPRIVEEALRSELTSSEGAEKDPGKA